MNNFRNRLLTAAFAIAVIATASTVLSQVSNYPTYRGTNQRQASGQAESAFNPGVRGFGLGNLTWFRPNAIFDTAFGPTLIRDNTSPATEQTPPGSWISPPLDGLASFVFSPTDIDRDIDPNVGPGGDPFYVYTTGVPSTSQTNPSLGATRTFTWIMDPADGQVRDYALYVWIPVGPTFIGPTPSFQQRFQVYGVTTGPGAERIIVVDAFLASGWTRLGRGGPATDEVFQYNGTNPIRITLYNTIPLNQFNQPVEAPGNLVYADAAMAVPAFGNYRAQPVVNFRNTGPLATPIVVGARTSVTPDPTQPGGVRRVGIVEGYTWENGQTMWQVNPAVTSTEFGAELIAGNAISAGVNQSPSLWLAGNDSDFPGVNSRGDSFRYRQLVDGSDPTQIAAVTYAPVLPDGEYDVFIWMPGNPASPQFGTAVRYEVQEGADPVVQFSLSQRQGGWARLGNRSFRHVGGASGGQLRVSVTNITGNLDDLNNPLAASYANAVRFVGAGEGADIVVDSTPILGQARVNVGGDTELRDVMVIAAEDGRIYCFQVSYEPFVAPTLLWAYPSLPRLLPNGEVDPTWQDPNHVAGLDGPGGIAQMPIGFSISSGLIADLGGEDVLFIASQNGRVYAINMTGRGDGNPSTATAGTTTRRWSFPNDYPFQPAQNSALGSFIGSVLYDPVGANGEPTIYIPARQGRVYAVDAAGNANRTTTVRWTYPALNEPALGEITMTPLIAGPRLFFGTNTEDGIRFGELYCLNKDTGAPFWLLLNDPDANPDPLTIGQRLNFDSFFTSPAFGPGLDQSPYGVNIDTFFISNDNGFVYAINAANGDIMWATDELFAAAGSGVVFTYMDTYNFNRALELEMPVLIVPTSDGRFSALFAELRQYNIFTDFNFQNLSNAFRLAWEWGAAGNFIQSSVAPGQGFMYGGDNVGYFYAFSNNATIPGQGPVPGQQTITPNDPNIPDDLLAIQDGRSMLITRERYQELITGTITSYNVGTDAAGQLNRNPPAFDWGEELFVLIYDLPPTTEVGPYTITVSVSASGSSTRNIGSEVRDFNPGTGAPTVDINGNPVELRGYAVVRFPLTAGGQAALAPGEGAISVSAQRRVGNNTQQIPLNPQNSRIRFLVANPIALVMGFTDSSFNVPVPNLTVGFPGVGNPNLSPVTAPENLVNGNPNLGLGTKNIAALRTSTGFVDHGGQATSIIGIADRSLITLLRGPNGGLDNVRIDRRTLAWQSPDITNRAASVWKPLSDSLFPNFEDLPVNFPNTSIDYPDIAADNLSAVKDPLGDAQNPFFQSVNLIPPQITGWNTGGAAARPTQAAIDTRLARPTRTDLTIQVPRYQPANGTTIANSVGTLLPAGYSGRLFVYVDSDGNSTLTTGGGNREAFRSFSFGTSVPVDENIFVGTPVVDLGTLAGGSGFTPYAPWDPNSTLSPWTGNQFSRFAQPFTVFNQGNVNMLNLRVAKGTQQEGQSNRFGWPLFPTTNNSRSWLDAWLYVKSDLDPIQPGNRVFAPMGDVTPEAPVILQKPRVGDRAPSELTTNPRRRPNANLGVLGSPAGEGLVAGIPARSPRVMAAIPIGAPTGPYAQLMRVIELSELGPNPDPNPILIPGENMIFNGPPANPNSTSLVPYSDPTFNIRFTVGETRLTTAPTLDAGQAGRVQSAPMAELIPSPSDPDIRTPFNFSNIGPAALLFPTGNLMVAWASNRLETDAVTGQITGGPVPIPASRPATNVESEAWRIYFGALTSGGTTREQMVANPPAGWSDSNLRDLSTWQPVTASQWFSRAPEPFPQESAIPSMFNPFGASGVSVVPGTAVFGAPSFPTNGGIDPASATPNQPLSVPVFMAFMGSAQVQLPETRRAENRIYLAQVAQGAGGQPIVGAPILPTLPNGREAIDPTIAKSRPSIVQTGNSVIVFYSATASNQSRLYATRYNVQSGAWTPSEVINLELGFTTIDSPSVSARRDVQGNLRYELTFSGKSQDATNPEIYYATLRAGGGGGWGGLRPVLESQPRIVDEPLVPVDGTNQVFRAQGLAWQLGQNPASPNYPSLALLRPDGTRIELEVPDTRQLNSTTRLVSFQSRLGGIVYLDPNAGTVRLTDALVAQGNRLMLTYRPRIFRVSETASASSINPSIQYDYRFAGNIPAAAQPGGSWFRVSGGTLSPAVVPDAIRTSRLLFTYGRLATGAGQGARPFMRTMRFGIQLPQQIHVQGNGNPTGITVNGLPAGTFVEIDPVNGRLYVTDTAEFADSVTVQYVSVDPVTGNPGPAISGTYAIGVVPESGEAPVPMTNAQNESSMVTILDPINPAPASTSVLRPGLVWMFWTSTRNGFPDVYFQTLAPRFSAQPRQ
jgi:outer membrane protein assembly factor BamB